MSLRASHCKNTLTISTVPMEPSSVAAAVDEVDEVGHRLPHINNPSQRRLSRKQLASHYAGLGLAAAPAVVLGGAKSRIMASETSRL